MFGVFWLFIKRKLSLILLNIKEETVTDANFRKIMGEGRSTTEYLLVKYIFSLLLFLLKDKNWAGLREVLEDAINFTFK